MAHQTHLRLTVGTCPRVFHFMNAAALFASILASRDVTLVKE